MKCVWYYEHNVNTTSADALFWKNEVCETGNPLSIADLVRFTGMRSIYIIQKPKRAGLRQGYVINPTSAHAGKTVQHSESARLY